jgi:hypothetical protein
LTLWLRSGRSCQDDLIVASAQTVDGAWDLEMLEVGGVEIEDEVTGEMAGEKKACAVT